MVDEEQKPLETEQVTEPPAVKRPARKKKPAAKKLAKKKKPLAKKKKRIMKKVKHAARKRPANRKRGRPLMYPDKTIVRMPAGSLKRINTKAKGKDQTQGEYLRNVITRAIGI